MQDLPPLLLTLLFIILLTLSGLFSATEIAFFFTAPGTRTATAEQKTTWGSARSSAAAKTRGIADNHSNRQQHS